MEPLQRLTRKQLETLQRVGALASPEAGVPLNRLATSLGIRAPTALGHLVILEDLGLIARVRGKSRPTPRGQRTLREYVRHHRVAEMLFAEAGLSVAESCRAAREVDLALSHTVVENLCLSERHPAQCPHGEPIEPCASGRGHAAARARN